MLSLFFAVTDNGKTYLAGMFGGAGTNAITLPYICAKNAERDCDVQMLRSIEMLMDEPVVVHLGNHPYNSKTLEKREQQLKEGGNPFIAPDSWREFLSGMKVKIEKIIKDNEVLEREMKERGIE